MGTSSILWPTKFSYKRVKLDDEPSANLIRILPDALAFIGEAQLRRSPILVHCTRGISRSASVVIAFLMLHKMVGYDVARKIVDSKRQFIYPNPGFHVQLKQFETMMASVPRGHWGQKMEWFKSASSKVVHSSFSLEEALEQEVSDRLDTIRQQVAAACDITVSVWRTQALFFEYLHLYKIVPSVTLVASGRSMETQLTTLAAGLSAQDVKQAMQTLIREVGTWLGRTSERIDSTVDSTEGAPIADDVLDTCAARAKRPRCGEASNIEIVGD